MGGKKEHVFTQAVLVLSDAFKHFSNACVVGCVGICLEGGRCLFVPSVTMTSWMYHGHNNMLPWLEARLSELVSMFTRKGG